MDIELLSPVGNFEMLYAAVNNGCDAVYLGGKSFGARAFANNFTNEELLEVVKYCHLRGVKVYITVNTLIFNDEVEDFINYIKFLNEINVDALIMQDLGMINLVHELFPEMEIHASTQAHTYNENGVNFLKKMGVKRVVAARECDLKTIEKMAKLADIEVFVYGALCVSYSGCCLFSSLNGGRSGNRGECVGSCRLPYSLEKNDLKTYLLSMQDLNVIDRLDELLKTGVKSLKIEGRMKSPLYVGYVTRIFRLVIDAYKNGKKYVLSNEERDNLKKLFYRGFTYGYLFSDDKLVNIKGPNHQGLLAGKIIGIDPKYIKIKLSKRLAQGMGIRFVNSNKGMIVNYLYNKSKKLISSANKDEIIYLDNKVALNKFDDLAITLDNEIIVNDWEKKIPINMIIKAKIGEKLLIEVNDGEHFVTKEGPLVENSIKTPVTADKIKNQVSKLGNTVYSLNELKLNVDDNIFVGIKDINDLRRSALEALDNLRIGKLKKDRKIFIPEIIENSNFKPELIVTVNNEAQLKCILSYNVARIYIRDYNLFLKYKNLDNVYYLEYRVGDNYIENKRVCSSTATISEKNFDGDYTLNITNDFTGAFLRKKGMNLGSLSVELSLDKLQNFKNKDYAVLIYGRVELMIIKKNILANNKGFLYDIHNEGYPYYFDKYLHILHKDIIDRRDSLKLLDNFRAWRIDFYDESVEMCKKIIESVINDG